MKKRLWIILLLLFIEIHGMGICLAGLIALASPIMNNTIIPFSICVFGLTIETICAYLVYTNLFKIFSKGK